MKQSQNSNASDRLFSIDMPQRLTREWVEKFDFRIIDFNKDISLDFTKTETIDSAGASLISLIKRTSSQRGRQADITNAQSDIRDFVETWAGAVLTQAQAPVLQREGYFTRVGDSTVSFFNEMVKAFSVLTEMIYWGTFGLLKRRDFRKGSLGDQMYQLGFRAVGIVGLLAFLIGVVLALQTAIQLKQFGADIFLAPMIGISMIRELGPLMTAIILAGRTGSATTAEIATMGVQEELDALKTMSLNPVQYVIVPKFWAITLTMPCLSVISVISGILGGFLVAILYLDTSANLFWSELGKNIFLKDFMAGFIKSVVFSWLIIWIGAFYGLKVRGGAEEVGRETTNSVVTGIFVIIIADAIFSFII